MLVPLMLPLLLAACGRPDPVDDNAVTPAGNLLGDIAANGLATPANAATAEAVQQAGVPAATGGPK